jgi:Zn-dependent peptidase ImmA (M78 family)
LRDLTQRIERLGINVIRSGIVGTNTRRPLDVGEFRGFSLTDDYAPFIFINGVDAKAAQIFTLVHEFVHICRGESGITGLVVPGSPSEEVMCNRVAAEVLVPGREFTQAWDSELPVRDAITALTGRFRVSRFVIAIRACESGLIERALLDALLTEYREESRSIPSRSGGDFYRTLVVRNGRVFTEGLLDALNHQRVLVREAANLLEAKPSHLSRLAQELRGSA